MFLGLNTITVSSRCDETFDIADGVLSYSMPQGEKRGTDVELFDFTYDGQSQDDYLKGGLGQLTDGAEGHYIFRLDPDDTGRKGYDWVGWKNETVDRPPIEIIFEFDKVRNFSAVRFHCNNMFSKEVRAFREGPPLLQHERCHLPATTGHIRIHEGHVDRVCA